MPVNEYVAGLFGRYSLISAADAKQFFRFDANGKANVIVRPRDFLINDRKRKGTRGKVAEVNFFGTHWELNVSWGKDQNLTVATERDDIKAGSVVEISLCPGRV